MTSFDEERPFADYEDTLQICQSIIPLVVSRVPSGIEITTPGWQKADGEHTRRMTYAVFPVMCLNEMGGITYRRHLFIDTTRYQGGYLADGIDPALEFNALEYVVREHEDDDGKVRRAPHQRAPYPLLQRFLVDYYTGALWQAAKDAAKEMETVDPSYGQLLDKMRAERKEAAVREEEE